MSWPEILVHPFVKDHVVITSSNAPSMPFTRPMSANTLQVKEQQRKEHIGQKNQNTKLVLLFQFVFPTELIQLS